MKRIILSFVAISAIALVSCKKVEPATPAEPGSATLTGTVYADKDLSNDTTDAGVYIPGLDSELATSGTKLTFVVNSGDLDRSPEPGFDYQDLIFTATLNGSGEYTVSLPAISTALNVDVYFDDFKADQRQYTFDGTFESENKSFFLGSTTVGGIVDGVTKIQDFTYNY
ncbi:hypothetical protein [Crocinitomix catalasitica]|uniref:hypothetical protein n=1 Tax=Crocinitomix catalasitica TaxID=184607 RepID=UPI000480A73F|nr:hypothetical protein [Crocinitomix catalasitica]